MFISKRIYTIIFSVINVISLVTILIVALVNSRVDIMQVGYMIMAVLCLMLVFLRLAAMNRRLYRGYMSPYAYKQTDEYKGMRYENMLSFIAIAIYIVLIFTLQYLF